MITKLTNLIDVGRGGFLLSLKMYKGLFASLVVLLSLAAFPRCGSDTGALTDQVADQVADQESETEALGEEDVSMLDYDGDNQLNGVDPCPLVANESSLDTDNDGRPDDCDDDIDGDDIDDFQVVNGVRTRLDPCPLIEKKTTDLDTDGDRIPNACDPDDDDDNVLDEEDNCPLISNIGTQGDDLDGDGMGDACDPDTDGDGVNDFEIVAGASVVLDPCPRFARERSLNTDNDALPNDCDDDDDGDNVLDEEDNCPLLSNANQGNDLDADGFGDACDVDDDGDGLIEIRDEAMLRNVRYNLAGNGYATSANAAVDSSACGNGRDITACNGYELTNGITLTQTWIPIGEVSGNTEIAPENLSFTGTFDGNGFSVKGLAIPNVGAVGSINAGRGSRHKGFFANVRGTIHNLHLREGSSGLEGVNIVSTITGSNIQRIDAGVLVGHLYSGGRVLSCSSVNIRIKSQGGTTTLGDVLGGLVGYNEGTIQSSYAAGPRSRIDASSRNSTLGGLVGINKGIIRNSHASTILYGDGANGPGEGEIIGGFVGHNDGGIIRNSYYNRYVEHVGGDLSTFAIMADTGNDIIGGFVGLDNAGTITNCYTRATLIQPRGGTDTDTAGGFVGKIEDSNTSTFTDNYFLGGQIVVGTFTPFGQPSGVTSLSSVEEFPKKETYPISWDIYDWDFGTETQFPAVRPYLGDVTNPSYDDYTSVLCNQVDVQRATLPDHRGLCTR